MAAGTFLRQAASDAVPARPEASIEGRGGSPQRPSPQRGGEGGPAAGGAPARSGPSLASRLISRVRSISPQFGAAPADPYEPFSQTELLRKRYAGGGSAQDHELHGL
jgi:hypothetical protein